MSKRSDGIHNYQGTGITSIDPDLTVDFGPGTISGTFDAVVNGIPWSLDLAGNIVAETTIGISGVTASLNANIGTSLVNSFTPTALSGSMKGIFVGTGSPGGFANAFDFSATADSMNYDLLGTSLIEGSILE